MNNVFLQIGPITIYWYAILILVGIILGYTYAYFKIKKTDINIELFNDLVFYAICFGFVGARLWYVIFNFKLYINNPFNIIAVWQGGLAIHGGIICAFITILYFCKKYNINVFKITDIGVVSLIMSQIIGRFGNFVNMEAHGPETSLEFLKNTLHLPDFIINGMNIDGVYYHPTFLYEASWNFIGLIVMLLINKFLKVGRGFLTGFYLFWYGIGRSLIESIRVDALFLGDFRIAQVTSILMVIAGIIIMFKYWRKDETNRN